MSYPYDALFQAIGDSLDSTVKIAGQGFSISVKAFVESIRAKGFNIVPAAAPAQGALTDAPTVGAVAWAVLADAGHVRYWSYERKKVADFATTIGAQVVPIIGVGQVSDAACSHPFRTGTSIELAQGGGVCATCGAAIQAQAGDEQSGADHG